MNAPVTVPTFDDHEFREQATGLLSQQIWCFGRDIKRKAGNWLVERGFRRIPPPTEREDCSSAYSLDLEGGKRIVLRGYGVFIGNQTFGALFIERFTFRPRVAPAATFTCVPWTREELPMLRDPSAEESPRAKLLLLELIDWFIDYEFETTAQLGTTYRRRTLKSWRDGDRWSVAATDMVALWRKLSLSIGDGIWNPLTDQTTQIETQQTST